MSNLLKNLVTYSASIINVFNSFTAKWNFAEDESLVDEVDSTTLTFTRASSQSRYDASGVLQTDTNNIACYDHNPETLAALGLSLWESRTNSFLSSEDLRTAAAGNPITFWSTNTQCTVTTAATAAPDGNTTGNSVVENSANASHNVARTSHTITADTYQTFSLFIKAIGGSAQRYIRLTFDEGAGVDGVRVLFNPNTGAISLAAAAFGAGTLIGATTQTLPNGWYRITLSGKINASATSLRATLYLQDQTTSFVATYQGDGASGIYMWGAALEEGGFSTPYIVTTSAAATRAAPVCSTTDLSWFSATAGTFVASVMKANVTSVGVMTQMDDATENERITLSVDASANPTGTIVDGGVSQAAIDAGTATINTASKLSLAFAANDVAASWNGGTVGTDTSATLPTVTTLRLGGSSSAGNWNGWIDTIKYYNKRLDDDFLKVLST